MSAGTCCRGSRLEVFNSGAGFAAAAADCEPLCLRRRDCAYFSHSEKSGACSLCSQCDFSAYAMAYTSWQRIGHTPVTEPLRFTPSLGSFGSLAALEALTTGLDALPGRRVLFAGDSTVRYQFMHLLRAVLRVPLPMTLGDGLAFRRERGTLHISRGRGSMPLANQSDRGAHGDNFWNSPNWMVLTTPSNLTLAYVRLTDRDFNFVKKTSMLAGCDLLPLALLRAKEALTSVRAWPPDAVLWNLGLHLLHLHPKLSSAASHCMLRYEEAVGKSVASLTAALPVTTQLIYRTTNIVCEEKLDGAWGEVVRAYSCGGKLWGLPAPSCAAPTQALIRKACVNDCNMSAAECRHTLFVGNSTREQGRCALFLLRRYPEVHILDCSALTDGRCDATFDGRHFPALLDTFNSQLLRILHLGINGGRDIMGTYHRKGKQQRRTDHRSIAVPGGE